MLHLFGFDVDGKGNESEYFWGLFLCVPHCFMKHKVESKWYKTIRKPTRMFRH